MDDLTLVSNNRRLSGWTSVRVTRGCERIPNDFDLTMTERYSQSATALTLQQGDPCQVLLDDDLVITGYVDCFVPSLNTREHTIRITGRGKCQDLVDCAAEWPGGQISGASALVIAKKLAQPYGISVAAVGDTGGAIPQFNLMLGETPMEIIDRVCRYRAFLAYEEPDGNLLLNRVGTRKHGTGIVEGQNLESATATFSMVERYSEYQAFIQSVDVLGDAGEGGNLLGTAFDKGVPRHRRRIIISEGGGLGNEVAVQRAKWEAARRFGRSALLSVEVDSWRDGDGVLWTPNTLIPVDVPTLKLQNKVWIIGEVIYEKSDRGTHARLMIMPPEAFQPEPILLQPFPPDVPANAALP